MENKIKKKTLISENLMLRVKISKVLKNLSLELLCINATLIWHRKI